MRLRAASTDSFGISTASRLRSSAGLIVINQAAANLPINAIRAAANAAAFERSRAEQNEKYHPILTAMEEAARRAGSDSVLFTVVDRFGLNAGFEKRLYVRAIGWLWRSRESELAGPFFALGRSSTSRRLTRGGYGKTDEALAAEAGDQAAMRLIHTLQSGRSYPFMDDSVCAVVPAVLPGSLLKRFEPGDDGSVSAPAAFAASGVRVELPYLARQKDVLFQPETSPTTQMLDAEDILRGLAEIDLNSAELWRADGEADIARIRRFCDQSGARYVFLSRIREIQYVEIPMLLADGAQPAAGLERRADVDVEGCLFDNREKLIVWRDIVTGGTAARTEYVRHQARIRSDEQCVSDAARTAYAHLRSSFEDYKRKMDREIAGAEPKATTTRSFPKEEE